MHKPEQASTTTSSESFEEVINLFNIIPAGRGKAVVLLKKILENIQQESFCSDPKYPSILIVGEEGKRTHSRAFLNSLCLQKTRYIPAQYFDLIIQAQFFSSNPEIGYLILDVENMKRRAELDLYLIIRDRKVGVFEFGNKKGDFKTDGPIILTAKNLSVVPESILEEVNYVVEIEDYATEQLDLIVLQRLRHMGIELEQDEIVREIVEYGNGEIRRIVKFLCTCGLIMKADGRGILKMEDVKKAARL